MGTNVNAVCQTTHNQRVWIVALQVSNEVVAHLTPIFRTLACTHHTDDALGVQIDIATGKEHQRSILTLYQSLRIVLIEQSEHLQPLLLNEIHLFLRKPHRIIRIGKGSHKPLTGVRNQVHDVLPMGKHLTCRPQCFHHGTGIQQTQTLQLGQRDNGDGFLRVHCNLLFHTSHLIPLTSHLYFRNGANFSFNSGLSANTPFTRHTESTCARMHNFISGRRKMSCMKM